MRRRRLRQSVAELDVERAQIRAGWRLKYPQTELRQDREQVVENIGLRAFVVNPAGIGGEAIDFERQAGRRGRKLAHEQQHILIDAWVMLQVLLDVSAKRADVGNAALIHGLAAVRFEFPVPL